MSLLGQIAGFMVAAFGLGLGVGWLAWRAGRRSVPVQDVVREQRHHHQLEHELGELAARLRTSEADRAAHEESHRRSRVLLEAAVVDRDQLRSRLDAAGRQVATARAERDAALQQLAALQHRLAEYNIHRARTAGVASGVYVRPQRVLDGPASAVTPSEPPALALPVPPPAPPAPPPSPPGVAARPASDEGPAPVAVVEPLR